MHIAVVGGGFVSNPSMVTALSYTQINEICESHLLKDKHLFSLAKGTDTLAAPSHWINFRAEGPESYLFPLQLDALI